MEFEEGQYVVVPGCGVGRVESIETMDMGEGPVELYKIDLGEEEGCSWIPVDRVVAEGVRPVMSKEHVEEAWKLIESQEVPAKRQHWNRRRRRYNEMLLSNQPQEMAKLVGELGAVRSEKRLSFTERRMFDRAKDMLVDEIAASLDAPREEVEQLLEERFASAAA